MSDKLFQDDYQENLDATSQYAAWRLVTTRFRLCSQQRKEMPRGGCRLHDEAKRTFSETLTGNRLYIFRHSGEIHRGIE